MESYRICYIDGVFSEAFTFIEEKTEEQKREYFKKKISEYNKNPNKLYHISMDNIVRIG